MRAHNGEKHQKLIWRCCKCELAFEKKVVMEYQAAIRFAARPISQPQFDPPLRRKPNPEMAKTEIRRKKKAVREAAEKAVARGKRCTNCPKPSKKELVERMYSCKDMREHNGKKHKHLFWRCCKCELAFKKKVVMEYHQDSCRGYVY